MPRFVAAKPKQPAPVLDSASKEAKIATAGAQAQESAVLRPSEPPETPQEDIGYVKPAAAPVLAIEPPQAWTEKWNEDDWFIWNRMPRLSKEFFIMEHSKPNLCPGCKNEVSYTPRPRLDAFFSKGEFFQPIRVTAHDECVDRYYARARAAEPKPKTWWEQNCPDEFQKVIQLGQLKDRSSFEKVMAWMPGPDAKGIVCHGATGLGKSRSIWQLLKLHFEGRRVEAWKANEWGLECIKRFGVNLTEAQGWLKGMARADILFLDDIDKTVSTERFESELMGIIDSRCSHNRPTFITTQLVGDELAARFSPELGSALVRRLREFCTGVSFVKKEEPPK